MPTRFYNTLIHDLADFTPLTPGPDPANPLSGATVKLYSCGPTVYDFAHIGNFRAFLFADLLRRFLEFKGATVRHIMNMTDVGHMTDDSHADGTGEDKMAKAGQRLKENKKQGQAAIENPDDPFAVAQYFVDAFLTDARALNLKVVADFDAAAPQDRTRIMPRPTQWIAPFIAMIEKLLASGHAYIGSDGVVYYSVKSFPDYGKLSGNSLEKLAHGAGGRSTDRSGKRDQADFFLWKPDPAHIMKWPSPWGVGYPGWHIECSAMATGILGDSIDIHTGGEDNIFPHHECEIAQSEGATGHPFSQFWMHTRHLMVDGAKMSKSKGNFFTIRDLVDKGYDPVVIRFALINSRYRESMDFTMAGLNEAASAVTTLRDLAEKLGNGAATVRERLGGTDPRIATSESALSAADAAMLTSFTKSLDDDLNIAGALGTLFTWAAPLVKQKKFAPPAAASALAALQKIDQILAVIFVPLREVSPDLKEKVEALMTQRATARTEKNWPKSDELRKKILALGVEVKDHSTGSTWRVRLGPLV